MKNIFKYLALAGCMSFFFSCAGDGENEKVVDPYIEADPTTMSVDCAGIETVINIESNTAWTLSRTDEAGEVIDWVLFDRLYDDGTTEVAVKVLENSSLEGRTAIITFDADGAIAKLTITQAGNPDAEVEPETKTLTFDFSESAGLNWPAERADDWSKTCVALDSGRAQDNGGTATDNPHSRATFAYKLNDVDYLFTFVDPDNMPADVTHNIRYNKAADGTWGIIIGTWRQLGLPAIEGFRLAKVEMTQGGPTQKKEGTRKVGIGTNVVEMTSDKKVDVSKYTYASGGELVNQDTQGVTHTFNLTGTDDKTAYYITNPTFASVVCSLTLTYVEIR